jgi:hypothetical protein
MIVEDIRPSDESEWLWTLDLTELSREILRYRRLREKDISDISCQGDRSDLAKLDGPGIPPQTQSMV